MAVKLQAILRQYTMYGFGLSQTKDDRHDFFARGSYATL